VGCFATYAQTVPPAAPRKIQVLIITGQDAHPWREASPYLRDLLNQTGSFEVRVTEFRASTLETLNFYDVAILVYSDEKRPFLNCQNSDTRGLLPTAFWLCLCAGEPAARPLVCRYARVSPFRAVAGRCRGAGLVARRRRLAKRPIHRRCPIQRFFRIAVYRLKFGSDILTF
jgi:hypothetical protein